MTKIFNMFKVNNNIAKKSLKQIMVISAMATLLMASMGSDLA
jgi:hypothetical protein